MSRLLDATLAQLTMAFRTISTVATRSRLEPTTIQLVYVALAELVERRRLDDLIAAAVGVVDARAATEEAREEIRAAARSDDELDTHVAIAHRRALSHAQKGAVRTLANTVARLRADGVDLSAYRLAVRKGREDKRRARARRESADPGAQAVVAASEGSERATEPYSGQKRNDGHSRAKTEAQ